MHVIAYDVAQAPPASVLSMTTMEIIVRPCVILGMMYMCDLIPIVSNKLNQILERAVLYLQNISYMFG